MGGLLRDIGQSLQLETTLPAVSNGYLMVYSLEIVLLIIALCIMVPMVRRAS